MNENTTTASIKQELKEQRQMLKLQCLEQSVNACIKMGDMSNCIEQAKAFYAFVRT